MTDTGQPDLDLLMEPALSSMSLCAETLSLVPFLWASVIQKTSHCKSLCLGAIRIALEKDRGGQGKSQQGGLCRKT